MSIKNERPQTDPHDLTECVLSLAGVEFGNVTKISAIHLNGWLSHSVNWKLTLLLKTYLFSLAFGSQKPECNLPPAAHTLISKSWPAST